MNAKNSLRSVVAALGIMSLAAGCSVEGSATPGVESAATGSEAALVAAAKSEGEVVWYSGSQDTAASAAAKAFEQAYGIPVTVVRLTSSNLAQRAESEAASGTPQADVLSTVDSAFFTAALTKNITVEASADEIPNLKTWPKEFVLDKAAVVFGISVVSTAWNTKVVPNFNPTDWNSLLDPALKGQILLTDPRGSSAWADTWSIVLHDPNLGPDFIRKFREQDIRQVVDSALPGAQLLGAGEGGALVLTVPSTQRQLIDAGAPLKSFIMENPAPVFRQYMAVTDKAPHPNAARLFENWMLSKAGQTVYNKAHEQASPLGDLEGTVPLPKGIAQVDREQSKKDLPEILSLLGIS